MRRSCRWTLSLKPSETPAQPSTTTPVALGNTWRWSSHRPGLSSGPRYQSICWRSQGSSNKPRMFAHSFSIGSALIIVLTALLLYLLPVRGEKNFHIFYYIYAGLYHQDKLKTYRLPDRTPPRLVLWSFDMLVEIHLSFTDFDIMCICRYIDSQHRKVMQDIVSSKLYKEQFDAIQECFRNIGFTEEVQCSNKLCCSTVTLGAFGCYVAYNCLLLFLGSQLCLQNSLGHFEHRQYRICCHHIPTSDR